MECRGTGLEGDFCAGVWVVFMKCKGWARAASPSFDVTDVVIGMLIFLRSQPLVRPSPSFPVSEEHWSYIVEHKVTTNFSSLLLDHTGLPLALLERTLCTILHTRTRTRTHTHTEVQ